MSAPPRLRSDLLGAALFSASAGWAAFAGRQGGGNVPPAVEVLLASAAALVVARLVTHWARPIVPVTVATIAAVLLIVNVGEVVTGAPLGSPFGYANATGAFFAQAVVAGLMLSAASERSWAKVLGIAAATLFAAVPFVVGSIAPGVLVVLGVVMVVGLVPKVVVALCGALVGGALVVSVVLGATYRGGDRSALVDRVVDASITERRVALWHEALDLMVEHPATGVGTGGFAVTAETARGDPDARWAHNEFLQQGAETGVAGMLLLVSLLAWGFARLWVVETADVVTALGAVALAALGVQACIDYVLHFPAVPLAAAAVVGAAQAPRLVMRGRRSPKTEKARVSLR